MLNLNNSNIGDEGARLLADSFKYNDTIKEIYLCSNNIGSEGAKSLASMLMVNKSRRN